MSQGGIFSFKVVFIQEIFKIGHFSSIPPGHVENLHLEILFHTCQGAFTYEVRFLGRQVGQAASDFTKQAYVVKCLMRVGRQVKNISKPSDVICECSPKGGILSEGIGGFLHLPKKIPKNYLRLSYTIASSTQQ